MTPSAKIPAIRLLLVEGHAGTRQATSRLLMHRGFVVIEASTVAEAKAATIDQDHFNLVISDVELPDGTGLELMNWLRIRTPGLPGIALTFASSLSDQFETGGAGFAAHLPKPLNIDTLQRAIGQYASPVQR